MQKQARRDKIFRALADPTRRALLDMLRAEDANVSTLVSAFDVSQSAISQHLKILKDARLVSERKIGRENIYRLDPAPLAEAYDWIAHYSEFWEDHLLKLGKHLGRKHGKKNTL